ncbi:MAG TPA: glycoside hydrolase family 9 protein [Phnomibacter sp.]|nr:glycoside hydrolase family 9 protein [Phnomibacter sp.]
MKNLAVLLAFLGIAFPALSQTVIRINQLGYTPAGVKVAVLGSKQPLGATVFQLVELPSGKVVLESSAGNDMGAYGPFASTYRLHFSGFDRPGRYVLRAGAVQSPVFRIDHDVYKGAADFCLRYMRQQRTGFNPSLQDSCHTEDGYTLYGPMPDSTRVDVVGGWHDASDYLQYVITSANATYQLLAAWRDFPQVFADRHEANGLPGKNGWPDIADEARWGLEWLVKMHPTRNIMFHQIADDRDHISMRRPALDSQYGRGYQRPVYFVTGRPQGSDRFKNRSTGAANVAGKFASSFALGARLFEQKEGGFSRRLRERALNAYDWGIRRPGVNQTAPNRAPYFYEEDNWADDMQLAASQLHHLTQRPQYVNDAARFAAMEPITPWMGADTARHYQWYPFANAGHYEMAMAKNVAPAQKANYIRWMKEGLERVRQKGSSNAFYRGVPFIWCSNNLTVAIANQAQWYRMATGDHSFAEFEQANVDWLFGCNPWGTGMVYGLPAQGDTPEDPHSWFTHSGAIHIDGGLVDGPVYTSIYNSLIGITLTKPDAYAEWQSGLAVYHDDYGDYSTNEPTMDGTASLIYLLAAKEAEALRKAPNGMQVYKGAIVRGDSSERKIALVFTGHDHGDGMKKIQETLNKERIRASFFVTGKFIEQNAAALRSLRAGGHYIGAHSMEHLLYADWTHRDSLLVTRAEFETDLMANYTALAKLGITQKNAPVFLPPYEWYNDSIAAWTNDLGLTLINNTPGTLSAADYTTPSMLNYRDSDTIYQSIMARATNMPYGLNGYFLLLHTGVDRERTDAFYLALPLLVEELKGMGYRFVRVDEMTGLIPELPPVTPKALPAKKAPTKKPVRKKRR